MAILLLGFGLFFNQRLAELLTSLTAGVLAFDGELRLTASNQSAARILEADFDRLGQYPLPEWLVWQPELEPLVTMLYQHFETDGDWQQQVELTDDRLLLVRASRLPETAGWVVVFDDVTDLVHAQRDAAWREVARRLAHEIRNPLTPIQLSAERLAMKLSPRLDEAGADFLTRSTEAFAIVQTGETRKYGNVILKKGVIPVASKR